MNPEIHRVKPRQAFAWLMPWGPIDPAEGPLRPGSPIAPPYPDIVIASGRRTVAYLRAIKRAAGSAVLTVCLKDPRTGASAADLIWVPNHDGLRGANVITTLTSPHRIAPERLRAASLSRPEWAAESDTPLVGVLLGGDSRHHRFTAADTNALLGKLTALVTAGARLVVTPSRRTPHDLANAMRRLCVQSGGYFWDGTGENPYLAILAQADHLVVSADSVNMLGEAVATGKPVHLFTPTGGHTKISAFVNGLIDHGAVRMLSGHLESWAYPPLDATPVIAIAVAEAFVALRP